MCVRERERVSVLRVYLPTIINGDRVNCTFYRINLIKSKKNALKFNSND